MKISPYFQTFEAFNQKINIDKLKYEVAYNVDDVSCIYHFTCHESKPIVTKRVLRRGHQPDVEYLDIDSMQDMYNLYLELFNGRLESEFKQIEPIQL